ncbi:MAG: NAD(+)/NADH kinase [Tissierellaceae bacterium]|nr:NAD(+)/NADH kinase [Tissierellaceae bacterium]
MNKQRIINIISNRNFESRKTSAELTEKLKSRGFVVKDKYDNNAELNICVGGDGSFLRAVHRNKFPAIPFVGINTGHLGFFQEILPDNIDEFINKYINKEYIVEEILLVDAEVCTKEKCYFLSGVNEIVVKGARSKVIHLDVSIDGNHLEDFSGDGMIISTPSGSTAYNFSVGGSIIYPTLNTLQIAPLAPISSKAYRSLFNSVVVPGDSIVSLRLENRYTNSTLIVNDGVEFKYDNLNHINFKISDKKIYKLIFNKDMYWSNLRSKFL